MTLVHSPSAHTQPGTAKTVADILTAAADLIEPEGAWIRGDLARTSPRGKSVATADSTARCWCAEGAIRWAAHRAEKRGDILRSDAFWVLSETIGNPIIHEWNDKRGRTQAEVVAALRAAADKARTAAETGAVGTKASAEVNQKDTPS